MSNLKKKSHGAYFLFLNSLRDAIFVCHDEDKLRFKLYLKRKYKLETDAEVDRQFSQR